MELNISGVEAFNRTKLPAFIALEIGRILKAGRLARTLSLEEASTRFRVDIKTLISVESGSNVTPLEASYLASHYGLLTDRIDILLIGWALLSAKKSADTSRRKHLSVVGQIEKPWEKEIDSIEKVISYSRKFLSDETINSRRKK